MPDRPHTAVQLLLTLRQFPGFAHAELGELATVAENVETRSYAAGEPVISGPPPRTGSALHLVVEGKLVSPESGKAWGPHDVLGALEAIARRHRRETVIADVPTKTLRLGARDYREILEDNFGLLTIARRSLARALLAAGPHGIPAVEQPDPVPDRPLDMVERMIVLRTRMPFGRGRVEALAALAQAAEEVRLPAGTELAAAGELATGTYVLLDGTVSGGASGSPFVLGRGQAVGALETLAESPFAHRVTARTAVRALRFPGAALFDVLEDHAEFALALLEHLAAALITLGVEPASDVGIP